MINNITNNIYVLRGVLPAVFLIAGLSGCGNKNQDYVAVINNVYITKAGLEKRISKLPERYQDVVKANKNKFIDDFVIDELIYQQSLKQHIDKNPDVAEIIEEAKKKIVIAKFLKDNVEDKADVDDMEVREYYDNHPNEFQKPEIFRASHIMVKTEAEAEGVLARLSQGERFETLAKEISIDPTKDIGGDIGYFVRGQVDEDFEKVCTNMKIGEISGVVKTRYAYHIIKLTDKQKPTIEGFADIKERIRHDLVTKKRKKMFGELIEKLKKENKVIVKYEPVPEKGIKAEGVYGSDASEAKK